MSIEDKRIIVLKEDTKLPINPSTEEKQDNVITRTGEVQASPTANTILDRLKTIGANVSNIAMSIVNAIDSAAYDLNAAAFSSVTAIADDFILDSIEFNFSTTENKTITVTTADGTILYKDTNSIKSIQLNEINQAFNGGDNITVSVTQFSSPGTMDCVLRIKQGSNTLVGIPETTIPEHKTYLLYGSSSGQVDELTPAAGKRIRLLGFYGTYTVDAAFSPSVIGSISFGTGGISDRTKVLGAAGEMAGKRTVMFTQIPMNRLGDIDEVIRFTMATYSSGNGNAVFIILYNEE